MKSIIISFKPNVFPALCTKQKRFEYRSRMPEGSVVAYIYLSSPIKMIVGKMELAPKVSIEQFIKEEFPTGKILDDLNNHLKEGARYFSPIKNLSLLERPICLENAKQLSPNFSAPQGYIYLDNYEELKNVLESDKYLTTIINPACDRQKLGLFSTEIIAKYSNLIDLPIYLIPFFN